MAALYIFRGRSADQGFGEAETAMGVSYHDGKFVKQDIPESLRWYRRGAEHGYAVAQVKLGDAYLLGEDGVVKDPVAAEEVAPKGSKDPAEAASWTAVARALMNTDEFITRE